MSDPTLASQVTIQPTRSTIVAQCAALVDDEVKAKGGLGGIAIKGAYATVKAIKPGFVEGVIDALFDDWVGKLERHYAAWRGGATTTLDQFLAARAEDVAEDLLAVTDQRAADTTHRTAAKLYDKLRPSAKKNVVSAIPRLGALMARHAGAR
jgi:hypothetical protein